MFPTEPPKNNSTDVTRTSKHVSIDGIEYETKTKAEPKGIPQNNSRTDSSNDANNRTPRKISSTQNQNQTLINESINWQYEARMANLRRRRQSSKASVMSLRTNRIFWRRRATRHSLTITNIEEFGNTDTGVEVSVAYAVVYYFKFLIIDCNCLKII